jgi:hypothetical protein
LPLEIQGVREAEREVHLSLLERGYCGSIAANLACY